MTISTLSPLAVDTAVVELTIDERAGGGGGGGDGDGAGHGGVFGVLQLDDELSGPGYFVGWGWGCGDGRRIPMRSCEGVPQVVTDTADVDCVGRRDQAGSGGLM